MFGLTLLLCGCVCMHTCCIGTCPHMSLLFSPLIHCPRRMDIEGYGHDFFLTYLPSLEWVSPLAPRCLMRCSPLLVNGRKSNELLTGYGSIWFVQIRTLAKPLMVEACKPRWPNQNKLMRENYHLTWRNDGCFYFLWLLLQERMVVRSWVAIVSQSVPWRHVRRRSVTP